MDGPKHAMELIEIELYNYFVVIDKNLLKADSCFTRKFKKQINVLFSTNKADVDKIED